VQVSNVQSDALFILLVEKDAAFMRLAEDRFYQTYPCIIITAKGQPDVASRSPPPSFHRHYSYLLHLA
jgi:meiotic recombination protein SPO11